MPIRTTAHASRPSRYTSGGTRTPRSRRDSRDAEGSRGGTTITNITKSVEVGAPVEKVFEMLDNPENFPVYVPNVTKVSNIRRSEKRLGDTFDVVYSMMGMEFPETFTYSEYAKPKRLAARYEGMMPEWTCMTMEPNG